MPRPTCHLQHGGSHKLDVVRQECGYPSDNPEAFFLQKYAASIAVVEAFTSMRLGPEQYIDDLLNVCSSAGAVRAIASPEPRSVCSRFAAKARCEFHYKVGKSAELPMGIAAHPGIFGVPVVEQKEA